MSHTGEFPYGARTWRRLAVSFVVLATLLLIPFGPRAAVAADWHFETLDGHQNGPTGQIDAHVGGDKSVLLYGGRPHVWYMDWTNMDLRHAWWTGTTWMFETLDGHQNGPTGQIDGSVGFWPTAVLYGGQPHVWYYDGVPEEGGQNGDLRHAWWTGAAWHFESLDGNGGPNGEIDADVGQSPSATLYQGTPHVWYFDVSNENLRHGWWTGWTWLFETLDGHWNGPTGQVDGPVGTGSTVVLYGGLPHVWYHHGETFEGLYGHLRHAWWTGSHWMFETLDGHQNGPNGQVDSTLLFHYAAAIYQGHPHVWYSDFLYGTLRHGWWTGAQWIFETLDGAGGPNGRVNDPVWAPSSVVMYGGHPHITYPRTFTGDLRHAWWTGWTWMFETLDGHQTGPNGQIQADVGWDSVMTLYGGQPHAWYSDSSTHDLRHAWYG